MQTLRSAFLVALGRREILMFQRVSTAFHPSWCISLSPPSSFFLSLTYSVCRSHRPLISTRIVHCSGLVCRSISFSCSDTRRCTQHAHSVSGQAFSGSFDNDTLYYNRECRHWRWTTRRDARSGEERDANERCRLREYVQARVGGEEKRREISQSTRQASSADCSSFRDKKRFGATNELKRSSDRRAISSVSCDDFDSASYKSHMKILISASSR